MARGSAVRDYEERLEKVEEAGLDYGTFEKDELEILYEAYLDDLRAGTLALADDCLEISGILGYSRNKRRAEIVRAYGQGRRALEKEVDPEFVLEIINDMRRRGDLKFREFFDLNF